MISDYLGGLNEDLIKDNFVIVYEVFYEKFSIICCF